MSIIQFMYLIEVKDFLFASCGLTFPYKGERSVGNSWVHLVLPCTALQGQ